MDAAALAEKYRQIAAQIPQQQEAYLKWLDHLGLPQLTELKARAARLGLLLELRTGRIRYDSETFAPLILSYDICYVRHGKTPGNTEPRVFQGFVDYPSNFLNSVGEQQANEAAAKLKALELESEWSADLVVLSPLQRAVATARPFINANPSTPHEVLVDTREMAFGEWDNIRVIDLPATSEGHLFYLEQNAVVKASAPHIVDGAQLPDQRGFLKVGMQIPAECFLDVLERMRSALLRLNEHQIVRRIQGSSKKRAKVVFFGHSMAGAAVSILMGHGKTNVEVNRGCGRQLVAECGNNPAATSTTPEYRCDTLITKDQVDPYLGFDGTFIMPNAVPTLLVAQQPSSLKGLNSTSEAVGH